MLKVIQPGMLTTIQDNGRFGYLAFGLPRAGYMDRYAARMANILCGNLQDTAVLEMTLSRGCIRVYKILSNSNLWSRYGSSYQQLACGYVENN